MDLSNKRPQGQLKIKRKHPLAKGLCLCVTGDNPLNIASNKLFTKGSTTAIATTVNGIANTFDNTNNSTLYQSGAVVSTSDGVGTGDFTLLSIGNPSSRLDMDTLFSQREYKQGSHSQFDLMANTGPNFTMASGTISFITYEDGFSSVSFSGGISGDFIQLVIRRSGTNHAIYANGLLKVETSLTVRDVSTSGSETKIGNLGDYTTDEYAYENEILLTLAWDRALLDEEIAMLNQDPYQMLESTLSLQDAVYAALFQDSTPPIFIPPSIFQNANRVIK